MDKAWQPSKHGFDAEDTAKPSRKILIAGGVVLAALIVIGVLSMRNEDPVTADIQSMGAQVQQQEQQIASLTAERDALKAQLATPTSATTQSADELDRLLAICSRDMNEATKELDACEEQNDDINDLISDAGRKICCIERVSDPSINAYEVDDDRIVCVSEGGTTISC